MSVNRKLSRRKYVGLLVGSSAIGLSGCLSNSSNTVESLPRPFLGDEQSERVVRVFEDLGCPACRTYQRTVFPQLEEEYIQTNQIRYEYYDYVLPASPISNDLANVARGVQDELGLDEFWNFVETVFERQNELSQDLSVVQEIVTEIGISSPDKLINESIQGLYNPVIDDDEDFGDNQYSVRGTPTVVVNDKPLGSSVVSEYSVLKNAIEAEFDF